MSVLNDGSKTFLRRGSVENIYVVTLEMQMSDFRGENLNLRLLMQPSDLEKLRSQCDVHKPAG